MCAGAGRPTNQEGDESVDEGNRPADVQLTSPHKAGSSQAQWNVPSSAAAAAAHQSVGKAAVTSKQVTASDEQLPQTRRSTRTQLARKRKG